MRNLKKIITLTLLITLIGAGVGIGSSDAAALTTPYEVVASAGHDDACNGLSQVGGAGCGSGQSGLTKVLSGVVRVISYLAGVIAIIMIIVSGIRYTLSGGDANKVSAAKTALIYALVGVGVAALAQVLVHFIVSTGAGAG